MKKFILSMMVLGSMMAAQGQTDVWTATLQHGNELTVFRMANAFVEAYNAAVDGDIITLSEGSFNGVSMNKSITIYGAGFEDDDVTGTRTTTINGDFWLANAATDTLSIHIEGCYFPGMVYFGGKNGNNNCYISSLRVQNCKINGNFCFHCPVGDAVLLNNVMNGVYGTERALTSLLVQNCCLNLVGGFPDLSPVIVDHCVINWGRGGAYYYTNDLFMSGNTSYCLTQGSNVRNCLFRFDYNTLLSIFAENCYVVGSGIFSDIDNADDGAYYTGRTWSLQQPDVWVGNDGTPIGPIGGLGWSSVPRIPVIRSLDLNVDGPTLKINYEAEVRE